MDSPELIPLLLIYGSETMGYKKKLFLLKDIFQFDTCNFPNVMSLFESKPQRLKYNCLCPP